MWPANVVARRLDARAQARAHAGGGRRPTKLPVWRPMTTAIAASERRTRRPSDTSQFSRTGRRRRVISDRLKSPVGFRERSPRSISAIAVVSLSTLQRRLLRNQVNRPQALAEPATMSRKTAPTNAELDQRLPRLVRCTWPRAATPATRKRPHAAVQNVADSRRRATLMWQAYVTWPNRRAPTVPAPACAVLVSLSNLYVKPSSDIPRTLGCLGVRSPATRRDGGRVAFATRP